MKAVEFMREYESRGVSYINRTLNTAHAEKFTNQTAYTFYDGSKVVLELGVYRMLKREGDRKK